MITGKVVDIANGSGKTGQVKKGFFIGRNVSVFIGGKKESLNKGSLIEFLNEKIQTDAALQAEVKSIGYNELIKDRFSFCGGCFGFGREGSSDDQIQEVFYLVKNHIELGEKIKGIEKIVSDPRSYVDSIKMPVVCFYKTGPTEFLGNFAICPNKIKVHNRTFQCAEAAFQWAKYDFCAKQYEEVLNTINPSTIQESEEKVQKLSKVNKFRGELSQFYNCTGQEAYDLNLKLRKEYKELYSDKWDTVKDSHMKEILTAKFEQNKSFMELLKATGDAYLLEHNESNKRDEYWSDRNDGSGQNKLGIVLREIRGDALGKHLPLPYDEQVVIRACAAHANNKGSKLGYEIF